VSLFVVLGLGVVVEGVAIDGSVANIPESSCAFLSGEVRWRLIPDDSCAD
jgi:hypothetical protein